MRPGKRNRLKKNIGQSIIEYSVLLGLLAAVFAGMQVYMRRGIQAAIKISADQLGNQEDGFAYVNPREGSVEKFTSKTSMPQPSVSREIVVTGGKQVKDTREVKYTRSDSVSKRKDDGWYNVPVENGWQVFRQEE